MTGWVESDYLKAHASGDDAPQARRRERKLKASHALGFNLGWPLQTEMEFSEVWV